MKCKMTIYIRFLFVVTIIFSKQLRYSMDRIYQIIDGNLNNSLRLNVTLFSKYFQGFILFCIDSNSFQFWILIEECNNNKRDVILRYNKISKVVPLKQLCGCDPCDETKIHLNIQLNEKLINVNCNQNNYQLFIAGSGHDSRLYPIPVEIINASRKVYVTIGNIGPYRGKDNVPVFSIPSQMIGCLEEFYFDNNKILFLGNDTAVKPTCSRQCPDNICNGGICQESIIVNDICDCSSTNLNGKYCNRSLLTYSQDSNTSYESVVKDSNIYLKMTWTQLSHKVYCLMEIIIGYHRVTIFTNTTHLVIDSKNIFGVNNGGVNFVSVIISNGLLIVKSNNKSVNLNVSSVENTQINVGFSKGNNQCEVFEGLYDFYYNPSQLRQVKLLQERTNSDNKSAKVISKMPGLADQLYKIGLAFISIGSIFICVIVVSIIYSKSRNQFRAYADRLTTALSANRACETDIMFTETGIYGQVQDEQLYDYISN